MNKLLKGLKGFTGIRGVPRFTRLSGAVFCLLLTSCSSSDSPEASSGDESTLHVLSASSSAELTRSVTELTSGSIGVFQTSTSDGYALQADKEYAYVNDAWAAVGEEIKLSAASASICAYAPYDAALTDYTAVPLGSGIYDAGTDLVYSTTLAGPVNAPNRNVSFTMKHAYSRVTLKIRRGSYTGTGAVSSVTVSGDGIYASSTLNLATGIYSGLVAGSLTLDPGITSTATDADESVGLRLVPSGSLPSGVTLTFVVDGYTLKATVTTYTQLEAGVNYQASVVINGQAVAPFINTTEWEEVPYDDVIYTGI